MIVMFSAGGVLAEAGVVYIPQAGHGAGFSTSLVFMNLSATTNRLAVKAFDSYGNPLALLKDPGSAFEDPSAASTIGLELPGHGTAEAVTMNEDPQTLDVGYVEVVSDFGQPFGVEAVFRTYSGSVLATATSVLPVDPINDFSFIAFADGWERSGIALLNPAGNQEDALVSMILIDRFGDVVDQLEIVLAPGAKTTRFVDEIFSAYLSTSGDFRGSVEVDADHPVTATVLKFEGSFMTTQTVQPSRDGIVDAGE